MAHDPAAREAVISLLKAAGFAERVPHRRRDRDPEPASGFTAYTEVDGSVLVCWVTPGGGNCASYHEVMESQRMAEAYAETAHAAGWTAKLGGTTWNHASLTPPGAPLHFPSKPLPDPCAGCGTLLCAECARHGLTAVHFRPDGICAFGHQLETPTPDLATRLTEWIKAENITGHYPADGIASRIVAQVHHSRLTAWLDQGGTDYLRDMCARIKDEADLTDAEFCHEHAHH